MMKEYHESLQELDYPANNTIHNENINKALDHLRAKVPNDKHEELRAPLTRKEIKNALKSLPNRKAAGMDSIP